MTQQTQPGIAAIRERDEDQWPHVKTAIASRRSAAPSLPDDPVLGAYEDRHALLDLLEAADRLRRAAREVWASIPAVYDYDDPMVQRHAKALNALGALVEEYAPFAAAAQLTETTR